MAAQAADPIVIDAAGVRQALSYAAAIPVVREAMIALSDGRVRQHLRSFIGLGEGRTFAIMPAALSADGVFGAKLVSVFHDGTGRKAHEGLVVIFDGASGAPVCLADAAEVTAIRTAAASAVATEALAAPAARSLAILGLGKQALAHLEALRLVRPLEDIRVWGRDFGRAQAFAERHGLRACETVDHAVDEAQIICTVTGAADPILEGRLASPGAHVNAVGSSGPGQAEIDTDLVARSRFIVDHREHVLAHGGEFLRSGLPADHIAAEIGEVLAGAKPGRTAADQITVYKSLGHAAQDLAVTDWLYRQKDKRP